MLEPDEDPPRLQLIRPVVEDREGGFEPVGLVGRVGCQVWREYFSASVGVADEDPVAGVRRRCGGVR